VLSVTVKGYKIEAIATGLNETTVYIDGQEYTKHHGPHNEYSQYIRPLCDDIRAGFVPFVGWPGENEDDQIFAEAVHWGGDPEDCEPEPEETAWEMYGLMRSL
jgi:hypothetical protein